MRHTPPTPTGSPLPLPPRLRSGHRRHTAGPVELAREAIEKFNSLLHELYVEAPTVDADAIASVARWLDAQPAPQREMLLRSRLDRLSELAAMREDPGWPLDPAQLHRIDLILSYVAGGHDLIPNDLPLHGQLDDALLVELAWPMFAEDVDDYRDFCRFRQEVGEREGVSVQQDDWLRARAEEGALWEQLHRVHEQAYVDHNAPSRYFRVS